MDLRQLRNIFAVVEQGSIAKAAAHLHISQPAITKSIQRLEALLDVQLFDRSSRGMEPTIYARRLRTYALMIHSDLKRANAEIAALKSGASGSILVGVLPLIGSDILAESVATLTRDHPDIRVRVVSDMSNELVADLAKGEYDFVLGIAGAELARLGLTQKVLFHDHLVVVMRSGHPLARLKKVAPRDLVACPWVLPDQHSEHRRRIDAFFEGSNLAPPFAAIESNSAAFVKELIARSDYVGILPASAVRAEQNTGALRIIEFHSSFTTRAIGLIRRGNSEPSPVCALLMQKLEQLAAQQPMEKVTRRRARTTTARAGGTR